jgi:hypothetical protein
MSKSDIAAGMTAVFGGAWTLLAGMTDFGWLLAHTDLWYPVITTTTRYIGPQLAPNVPWELFTLAAGAAFVTALLIRTYQKRSKNP